MYRFHFLAYIWLFNFNKPFHLWQIHKAAGNETQTTVHEQEIDESEDDEEHVEEHFGE